MLRYLKEDERGRCRTLWHEAFGEDSESFTDYYFTEKVKNNRILVLEEQGQIVSMLHQNPYRLRVGSQIWPVDYIVGVATQKKWRRRGCMRRLLVRMMQEMWEEGMPFCFLMPADEAIYRPFHFTWIFDQPKWELREDPALTRQPLNALRDSAGYRGYLATLADWMNRWLEERYEVYAIRDEAYLRGLQKELKSENGTLEVIYEEDRMVGMTGWWGLNVQEQRLLYAEPLYVRESGPARPAIMARIICLEQFVKAIRLREDAETEERVIRLAVEDPLVAGNRGRWDWHLNREASWLERPEESGGAADLELTIEELTSWLFGYDVPEMAPRYEDMVKPLQGIFLDEVV